MYVEEILCAFAEERGMDMNLEEIMEEYVESDLDLDEFLAEWRGLLGE